MMGETFSTILQKIGDDKPLIDVQPVSGGSISEAYKITTKTMAYFVKLNPDAPKDFFQKEAEGLRLLSETRTLRVPEVYDYSSASSAIHHFIVMEWLEGDRSNDTDEQLGQGLALLHCSYNNHYGLAEDNYIGALPQPNGWYEDWIRFFRDQRLAYQAELAEKRGHMPKTRKLKLDRLLGSLHQWLPRHGKPSLLHGDLWGGNWIVGPAGAPCLIDPAVFYGERELELAFTELFGGFSHRFYEAYEATNPLPPNYEERKQLYQLYYLLVHLSLFGESYGPSVDRILTYYVG